jgi:hypothetical protein
LCAIPFPGSPESNDLSFEIFGVVILLLLHMDSFPAILAAKSVHENGSSPEPHGLEPRDKTNFELAPLDHLAIAHIKELT